MEHGASEHVKELSPTGLTIKTEVEDVEQSTAYVEIELDVSLLKQEQGWVQPVISEPVFLVKDETLEDSRQGTDEQQGIAATSTCAILGKTSVTADGVQQGQLLYVKEELGDTDLDIGPTLHQHVDSHYRTIQKDLNNIKEDNTILNLDSEEVPPRIDDGRQVQVRGESIENCWKDNATLVQCNSITSRKGVAQSQIYPCNVCKQNFECQRYLNRHIKQIHGGKEHKPQSYRCDTCLKVFKSIIYLRQHSQQIHGKGSHKCTQCNKEFKCELYLLRHVRNTHSGELHKCDICEKMYKSRPALLNHVSSFHRNDFTDSRAQYSCNHCQKAFWKEPTLRRHIKTVHGKRIHRCQECNKTFKCRSQLQQHKTRIHGKPQHECEVCHRLFTTRHTLRAHVRTAHDSDDFQSKLNLHSQEVSDPRPIAYPHAHNYTCDYCLKSFWKKEVLRQHVEGVHGEKIHRCRKCNKTFKGRRSRLQQHKKRFHGKPQHECEVCHRLFTTRYALRTHVKKVHDSDDFQSKLNLHFQEVSEPRPIAYPHARYYTCNYCQKSFSKKEVLRRHIKGVHGEKIHRCLQCNKTFKCRSQLQQHKTRIHGKPQHECEVCHRLFTTRHTLRAHVKKAHGLGDFQSGSDIRSQEIYDQRRIDTRAVIGTGTEHSRAMKLEPADEKLELGPVVFQQMDSYYRPLKEEPQHN